MSEIILKDTTLCTIVRDEKMNPAGGIKKFVESSVPYVERAVIVDTGSIDGTREVLEELESKYPNLKVYDREFDNFAPSRNYSLSKAKTKRVMVLDADELLTEKDYKILAEFVEENPSWGYIFTFQHIYPNGKILRDNLAAMNPRLFERSGTRYEEGDVGGACEDIYQLDIDKLIDATVEIKHFLPPEKALLRKNDEWYEKRGFLKELPSEAAKRDGWKKLNPAINLNWDTAEGLKRYKGQWSSNNALGI